jgi:hypothetical protein
VVAAVLAVVVGAVVAHGYVARRAFHLDDRDRPHGEQLPLTAAAQTLATPGLFAIQLVLPVQPVPLSSSQPDEDGGIELLRAEFYDAGEPVTLVIRRWSHGSPQDSLAAERDAMRANVPGVRFGHVRHTRIAGRPTLEMDVDLSDRTVREYRFTKGGVLVGIEVAYPHGGTAGLDTALASLLSWRWFDPDRDGPPPLAQ